MTLYQHLDAFRYTTDSMLLYDFAIRCGIKNSVLDIGAGCGVIGLLIKRDTNANITLIEKNSKMVALCRQNASANNLDVDIVCDDFLEYKFKKRFDWIISNPPYYSSGVQKSENEDIIMAKYINDFTPSRWLNKAYALLNSKGSIVFCYDSSQIGEILSIIYTLKPKASAVHIQFIHSKANKVSKLVLLHIKKDSKSPTKILEPIIIMNNDQYCANVNDIFQRADCLSVDLESDIASQIH